MFVGRERELGYLTDRLREAREGGGGVVLVEGEAGAGKTALAHELTRRARAEGIRRAWGACLEGEGTAPYRPWSQLLRGLGLPEPEPDSRARLFAETVGALCGAAGDGLLLVVDDLHWADPSSLALLQIVAAEAAEIPLLLVGLYRGLDTPAELRSVLRERACSRLLLGGLSRGEIGRLAAGSTDAILNDAELARLRERSGGNPLFVLELLKLVDATGRIEGLPHGVRDVIEERVRRLADPSALRRASVLGREFPVAVFTEVTGEPPERLDEAAAAGLIHSDGRVASFSHALVQEALYAQLPSAERRRLHARAARAVAEDHAPEAVAYHLRQAGDAAAALDATVEAARSAVARLAYEHAAVQYEEALSLPGAAARRTELLLALARCRFRSGAVEEAWRHCKAAADLGRAAGDAAVLADAATVVRGIPEVVTMFPVMAQIHALCREALAMPGPGDPVREARLLAQMTITADPWTSGSGAGARALELAEGLDDPDTLLLALQARRTELTNCRHVHERLVLGERAIRLAATAPECALWGHSWRLDAFGELGERVPFDSELAAFTAMVQQAEEPLWRWRWLLVRANVAYLEGRFADGRALTAEAATLARRCRLEGAELFDLIFAGHHATMTGEGWDAVEPHVRMFSEQSPFLARSWLALVLARMGRTDEASRLWGDLLPHLAEIPEHLPEWLIFATGNAELLDLLGETAGATETYTTLLPFAGHQSTGPAHTPMGGPVTLSLGRLALLLEDWPAAEIHLTAALAESQSLGSPPFQALARFDLARLYDRRRAPGDARLAAAYRDEALREATRLGMTPLADRAASLSLPDPLSPRERQIASLVAEGLTNRQIATRLHLSERTVENHVSHICDKLGVPNRTLIATWHHTSAR